MIFPGGWLTRGVALGVLLFVMPGSEDAVSGNTATIVTITDPRGVRHYFASTNRKVLTFLGYSSSGYEDQGAMLKHAGQVLDRFDPETTIVNIGATAQGIGAVYELAKQRGFPTSGIVSVKAKVDHVPLSPWVDRVFFVRDQTWGGFLPGTERLSPTSTAMVENSDFIVAIGGGEVARDELIAARRRHKPTELIPADLNHQLARDKARAKAQPAPVEFRGAAAELKAER
jgi:hypothetical protein